MKRFIAASWIDGRRNGFNIGVGISVPGPQF